MPGEPAKKLGAGESSQCIGYSKSDETGVGREQQVGVLLEPELSPVMQTRGAVSVLTGVILVGGLVTLRTNRDVAAERFGTAVLNIPHGLEVSRGHTISELSSVLRAIEADYVGKVWHERLPRDLASGHSWSR